MVDAHGFGYVPDKADERDFLWRQTVAPEQIPLPASARCYKLGPVLDQGREGKCVAFAMAHLKLYTEFKEHRRYYDFDPHELYDRCKEVDGIPNEEGTYPRVALKILQDRGVLAKKAPRKLKEDRYFKAQSYVRLTSIRQIKESIIKYGPTFFGIVVDEGCYAPNAQGVIPEPRKDRVVGGHAILIVGYNDNKKCEGSKGAFLVKNSWGPDYGLKGYAWWPYTHFEQYDFDAYQVVDSEDLINV